PLAAHIGVTWTDSEGKPTAGTTIWTVGDATSNSFAPSTAPFMINYRVADLHALVKVLKEEGCTLLDGIDESAYGKFAWVIDPDGNNVSGSARSCRQRSATLSWLISDCTTPSAGR